METELLEWSDKVIQKISKADVDNIVFLLEEKNNVMFATILHPQEETESETLESINLYCEEKKILAFVWGFKENNNLKFYKKILDQELKVA